MTEENITNQKLDQKAACAEPSHIPAQLDWRSHLRKGHGLSEEQLRKFLDLVAVVRGESVSAEQKRFTWVEIYQAGFPRAFTLDAIQFRAAVLGNPLIDMVTTGLRTGSDAVDKVEKEPRAEGGETSELDQYHAEVPTEDLCSSMVDHASHETSVPPEDGFVGQVNNAAGLDEAATEKAEPREQASSAEGKSIEKHGAAKASGQSKPSRKTARSKLIKGSDSSAPGNAIKSTADLPSINLLKKDDNYVRELSPSEQLRLEDYEKCIRNHGPAFMKVARALWEIKSGKLYLARHGTFEGYCKDWLEITTNYGNRLIQAGRLMERLGKMPIGTGCLPKNEAQARQFSGLNEAQQIELAQRVKVLVKDEAPTAEDFGEARELLFPRKQREKKPGLTTIDIEATVIPSAETPLTKELSTALHAGLDDALRELRTIHFELNDAMSFLEGGVDLDAILEKLTAIKDRSSLLIHNVQTLAGVRNVVADAA